MDLLGMLGLRALKTLLPTLGAAVLLGLLLYEPTQRWFLETVGGRAQDRLERRLERVVEDVLPSPAVTPTVAR